MGFQKLFRLEVLYTNNQNKINAIERNNDTFDLYRFTLEKAMKVEKNTRKRGGLNLVLKFFPLLKNI